MNTAARRHNVDLGVIKATVAAVWGLTIGWITDMTAGTVTPDFYPGGSYYTGLLTASTITTLL